jgi:glycerophosphoryl diester phosphodiesterase
MNKMVNMKRVLSVTFFLIMIMVVHAQVDFIAHRGASSLAPENTVAAAKLAWELGADAVELDIYLTKDNRVMVIHDGNTKRTSGENYVVKNTDSEILRKLDVGSFKDEKYKGEKIPFLKEMIATIPEGKKLVVELKCGSEVLPFLKEVVKKSKKQEQIIFIGFDWQTIVDTKRTFPKNKCYWLCSKSDELVKRMSDIAQSGLDGIDLINSIIDQKAIDMAKEHNLVVVAWTVDDPKEAQRLINLGVTGITTNRPEWLKAQLKKM